MTLPARHRPGSPLERAFSWPGPLATEFDELYERINRFLESAAMAPRAEGVAWTPLADIRETDEAYVIECELPGLPREDIDIEVSEREIHVTGELKQRQPEGVLRRGTRRTGRFEYRAVLPTDVRSEDVSASLAEGVLTVTIPKAQATQPRHIEIQG